MKTPMVAHSAGLAASYAKGDVEAMWRARDAQVPMGHMGDAWDVANAACFLASDELKYVTGSRCTISIRRRRETARHWRHPRRRPCAPSAPGRRGHATSLPLALGVTRGKTRRMRHHRPRISPGRIALTRTCCAGEFDRRRPRHLVHRRLGRRIGDIGDAEMPDRGDRENIDDRAAALCHHHRNDVLHGEVGALEIDGENAIPVRFRHVDHAAGLGDADIVVEYVDTAIGLQAGATIAATSSAQRRRLRSRRVAALASDDLGGLFGSGSIAIDAQDLRAFARKGHGGALPLPSRVRSNRRRPRSLSCRPDAPRRSLPICRKLAGRRLSVNRSITAAKNASGTAAAATVGEPPTRTGGLRQTDKNVGAQVCAEFLSCRRARRPWPLSGHLPPDRTEMGRSQDRGVMSLATLAGILAQMPAGALIDRSRAKRGWMAAAAIGVTAVLPCASSRRSRFLARCRHAGGGACRRQHLCARALRHCRSELSGSALSPDASAATRLSITPATPAAAAIAGHFSLFLRAHHSVLADRRDGAGERGSDAVDTA